MISKQNILTQHITALCEDILSVVNDTIYYDNISSLLNDRINSYKKLLGISKFSIPSPKVDWCYSFTTTVYFDCYEDKVEIEFYNTNTSAITDHPSYHARLLIPKILISSIQPAIMVEGILYCNYSNKIIYIDYFNNISSTRIQPREFFTKWINQLDENERCRFINYYEILSEEERKQIEIISLKYDDDIKENLQCLYKRSLFNSNVFGFNLIIVGADDYELEEQLREMIPSYISIQHHTEKVPQRITKIEWIRRAISMIIREFEFTIDKTDNINKCIALFMKDYLFSKTIILEVSKDMLNESEFNSLRNYLSYPVFQ